MAIRQRIDRRIPRWARPLMRPMRFKGASGGRGSGKSHFFAEELVERMVCRPDTRAVCIREVQRSLKFSAKALIESKIEELGVGPLFEVTLAEIRRVHGSGLVIFEGMQDHTAESIKSLEGFDVAWVEEAQSISQRSLDLLIPTIREEGSELWFSWNPKKKTDAVDQLFASARDDVVRVHTTYRDNPFLPSTLRREAEVMREADPDKFDHVWGGAYDLGGNGRVYPTFRDAPFPDGNVDASVGDRGGELYVGQDFNINPMASVIAVRVADECHVLDCLLVPTSNTEEVCTEIRRRYPGRAVIFCPDPAGNARHTNARAGQTDFTIIRSFGFEVRAPRAHPLIVDRVNNANAMLCDTSGRRRVRVHPRAAHLIESLGSQTYKPDTNIPDKSGGYDHQADAFGYLLWQEFNVLASNRVAVSTFSVG
jgi:phage terminase large subunit